MDLFDQIVLNAMHYIWTLFDQIMCHGVLGKGVMMKQSLHFLLPFCTTLKLICHICGKKVLDDRVITTI
jgi:hypothetical protein